MPRSKSNSSGKYRKMKKGLRPRRSGGVKSKPEPRRESTEPLTRGKRLHESQNLVTVADALKGIEGLDAFQKKLPQSDKLQSQLNAQLAKAIKAKTVFHEYKGIFKRDGVPRIPKQWTRKERIVYDELPEGRRLTVSYFNEQIAKREREIMGLQERLKIFKK